ncbi:dTMP kinase [Streptomyces sp. NPDC058307]|uniref:dTMP kinase n=1 Tax=Streptomyces sp. NPDC058307 TaxID=3346439 RepID=UPI0036E153E4
MMHSHRGLFVALEGIDGAGKSATAEATGRLMEEVDFPIVAFSKQHPPVEDSYIRQHLAKLREIIWEHPPDDPYYRLGQYHWIHLIASWFTAISHCAVVPMLERGENVLVDNWISKSLARMRLNPEVEFSYAKSLFREVPEPDLVVLLDVNPAIAGYRKSTITAIEAGNLLSDIGITLDNYIEYQTLLNEELQLFAIKENWPVVNANGRTLHEVSSDVADIIKSAAERHFRGRM